jgi:NitT/TauT family transport system substrate-binding protein
VTRWVTEHSEAGTIFDSKRYTNFPSIVEDIQAGNLDAAFILAPLAMVVAREGSRPVKIVHLGHRDGTGIVVMQDSPYRSFADLRGKRMAIPHRYANQRILIERMKEQFGFNDEDLTLIDFPPPEMPAGLKAGTFDAYIVGEPHCAKAEVEGFGRVLYLTKDIWPGFISCVLVVTQDLIDTRPGLVQELVTGITSSGEWLDGGPPDRLLAGIYREGEELPPVAGEDAPAPIVIPEGFGVAPRMQAAQIGGLYYGQPPELLKYVLSQPPDRVRYTELELNREEFAEIQRYAERLGFFARRPVTPEDPLRFEDYCDDRFERGALRQMPLR